MEPLRLLQAQTVEEAVALLAQGALPLAGGTVLVPRLARGLATGRFVDLLRLDALRGITVSDEGLNIGALTTLAAVAENPAVNREASALAAAARMIGNPHVRRAGTVGGNVAFGNAGADLAPPLAVLDATAVLRGADGERRVGVAELVAAGVPPGALIAAIHVPRRPARRAGVRRFAWRRSTAVSLATAAVSMELASGRLTMPRLAAGGLCVTVRLPAAEALLEGGEPSSELLDRVARAAAGEAPCEVHSGPDETYRRALLEAGFRSLLAELTAGQAGAAP